MTTETFDRYGRLDLQLGPLQPGSVLTLSDGSLSLDLEIYDGTVRVDATGRVMRGATSLPDGSVISVQLFGPTGRELFQAEPVVEDGAWSARIPDAVPETFFDSNYSVGWWGDRVSITFADTWR